MNKETKNEKSTRKMSFYIKRVFIILIILFSGFCINYSYTNIMGENSNTSFLFENNKIIDSQITPHDSIRNEMINVTHEYLTKITKGKVDQNLAKYFVDNALEHNIDLCFMLSQSKIETCFGTTGIGKASSKRSLFGIMKRHYSNYNDAITDYCKLLKKHYLVKGKTEKDLMNKYVTSKGARYAGNLSYEKELSSTYKQINNMTNLSKLQNEYFYYIEIS